MIADEVQELGAGGRVGLEDASHGRGDHGAAGLLHTPGYHAEVLRLDHHAGPPRIEALDQRICYLAGQSLLELGPPGIRLDHARYLRQAHYPPRRYIAHVGLAFKW